MQTMTTRRFSLVIAFALLASSGLSAQTLSPVVVASAGGGGTTADGVSIHWTLGEVAITTLRGDEVTLTQGFHQPPPGTTDVPTLRIVAEALQLSPNPANDRIRLALPAGTADAAIEVVDLLGRRLLDRRIGAGIESLDIDVSSLEAGNYVVRYVSSGTIHQGMMTVQR